jgi:hypothetical protein
MRRFLILLLTLLLLAPALAGPPRPETGTYKFVKDHTVKVATEYAGGRGINPNPVKWAEKTYKPGEQIKVDEFFWIDEEKAWKAKLVFHGTNTSVPMDKLKRIK